MPQASITDVVGKLNLNGVVGTLTGSLSNLTKPGGPLDNVQIPAGDAQLSGATQGAANVDASGIAGTVQGLANQLLPLVSQVPGASDVIRPIESALSVVEQVTSGDLFNQLQALATRLTAELNAPRENGFLGTLEGLLQLFQGAQELRPLLELIRTLTGASGLNLRGATPVLNAIPAAINTARALGALMSLESSLAEAERLTGVMRDQLSPASVGKAVGALESSLGSGSTSLASFVSGIDPSKPAEVAAARQAILASVDRLDDLEDLLSRSLGFGEATLVHLDVSRMRAEVGQSTALLSSVDIGPIRAAVQGLVDAMGPLLSITPPPAPATELDRLLAFLQDKSADIAAAITGLDLTPLTGPIEKGLGAVTGSLEKLAQVMAGVVASIRSALETVRRAVAALPFDAITSAVQTLLAPVNAVMDFIRNLVHGIGEALNSVIPPVRNAFGAAETAINTFKTQALGVLKAAADFIDALNLDQVIGGVADNVRGLANTLAQAQMTPYFDTAVDVIGTTADVFQALPLSLLPDSIKQEVDAAAAPIRAIDIEQVKDTVEGWFQIGPDGKFTLRKPIEDALKDLQDKYTGLITNVKKADPRQAIPLIDAELAKINTAIDELVPKLSLQPVQDAIDQVKGVLNGVDLRALLQPVDAAFEQLLAAVDQYSPAALLTPLEQRVTAARRQVVDTLKLDLWAPTLDGMVAQAKGILDKLDVDLLKVFREALGEINALFERAPDFRLGSAFGTLVSSLLSGAGLRIHPWTFDVVLGWLSGDSGVSALTGRAERTAAAVEATRTSVQALDLTGLSSRVGAQAQALREAVEALPSGAAKTQLQEALARMDPDRRLGALTANRDRYLGLLQAAAADCGALRSVGLSAVDVAMDGLGAAFAPFSRVRDFIKSLLRPLGIPNLDASLKDVVRGLLAILTPERLAGIFTPVLDAVTARIGGFLDLVVAPIKEAIADLQQIIATVDLAPLREGLESVYRELRGGIAQLAPSTVLAPSLSSFDALKAELLAFNPLAPFKTLIADLVATAHRVLNSLNGEELLREPIRIYDEVIKALEALNFQNLIGPVLDALDSIAEQVDTGLDRTAEALERLQQALPSGGGSSASASIEVG